VVARETKVSIEAVASAGTLITDSTVGTCSGLSVCGACWGSGLSGNYASEVSLLCVSVGDPKQGLTARLTSGPRHELQDLLLSSVVTVSELDVNLWFGLGRDININLNLRNCKVREGFEGILNRVRVLGCIQIVHVNLDGAGIVLATELVSKTQLEERFLGSAFELASQLLDVLTTIGITFGLRVVTFGTTTERAIIAFVTSITMALLVLEPRPVNTPSR
jgi:hypothetical protein